MSANNSLKELQLMLLYDIPFFIHIEDIELEVHYSGTQIIITLDKNNFSRISIENQQVPYKATILGGFNLNEEKIGDFDSKKYFRIDWDSDLDNPELKFLIRPDKILRKYKKGEKVELGIENVSGYHVIYKDGVTADFTRVHDDAFDFHFSTGFEGQIWKDKDGTHTIKFKGIRLDADEDGYNSESKFIISRSKYTDNLILILQDNAEVYLLP